MFLINPGRAGSVRSVAMLYPLKGYGQSGEGHMVIVDGLAVDATGLPRKEAFQEFSSLTRASAEYPEFLLARPMFTRELERPVTDFDGYFNVLERNALGEDIQGVDWFKVYKAAEDSISISSENMDSIKGVALLAAVMRDYEKADNYFRKYVAERPDELVYRAAWAHVLLFRKKFPEASRRQSVVVGIPAVSPRSLLSHARNMR